MARCREQGACHIIFFVEARKRICEWPRAMATLVSTSTGLLRHFWSTDVRKCMELWNDGGFEVGKFSKYLHSGVRFFGMLHPIPSKSQVLLGSLGDVNPLGFGTVGCWHDWFEFLGQHLGLVSTGDYAWWFKMVSNLSAPSKFRKERGAIWVIRFKFTQNECLVSRDSCHPWPWPVICLIEVSGV